MSPYLYLMQTKVRRGSQSLDTGPLSQFGVVTTDEVLHAQRISDVREPPPCWLWCGCVAARICWVN